MADHAIPENDARLLASGAALSRYFESVARAAGNSRAAAHWITGDLTGKARALGRPLDESLPDAQALGALIRLVNSGRISGPTAKEVFEEMIATGEAPESIVNARGLGRIDDEAALVDLIREAVASNPKAVGQYRGGKALGFDFFVAQVMKRTRGRANPSLVTMLLKRELERSGTWRRGHARRLC